MGRVCVLMFLLLFGSCVADSGDDIDTSEENSLTEFEYSSDLLRSAVARSLTERFYNPSLADQRLVDSIYESMSLNERAAQMIMVASSSVRQDGAYGKAKDLVESSIAGSVLFLKGTTVGFSRQVRELDQQARNSGQYSLLYACDCEPSLMHRKWADVAPVTPASNLRDSQDIRQAVRSINETMKEVGATLNFAPVVDIGTNKSIINDRSFGNNPTEIITKAGQFIRFTQESGVAATVKHFPGHGAVNGDSHKGRVYIDGDPKELSHFRETIEQSRPIAVMVGHITIKNSKTYGTGGLPASISRNIITNLLRREIAFNGLIVTDAMNMKAVSTIADADWKAVQAGVDLVVMPKNPIALNKKIAAALTQNDLLSHQLQTSIKKVIRLKLCISKL